VATRTISNAGGNWNSTGTWVEGAVPTAADDVVATGTSGAINITSTAACRSINLTNYTNTFTAGAFNVTVGTTTLPADNKIIYFPATMTYVPAAITFTIINSNATSGTLDFGLASAYTLSVNGNSTLANHLVCTVFSHVGRNFDTANFNITSTVTFSSTGSTVRSLTLGSSVITAGFVTDTVVTRINGISGSNCTFNAGTSRIVLNGICVFSMLSLTWYDVELRGRNQTASLGYCTQISSPGTCHNLSFIPTLSSSRYDDRLGWTGTLTVTNNFTATGSGPYSRAIVHYSTAQIEVANYIFGLGTATLSLGGSGTASLNGADFIDISVTGTNTPIGGIRIGDWGGNSGITFDAPLNRYWVGDSGAWADVAHWSLTSGGSGGADIPLPQDTAIVDSGSGFPVYVGIRNIYTNVVWAGCAFVATQTTTTDLRFKLQHGRLMLANNIDFNSRATFEGDSNNRISLIPRGTQTINHPSAMLRITPTYFYGPGIVKLLSDFNNLGGMVLGTGSIDINGFILGCTSFSLGAAAATRTIDFTNGGKIRVDSGAANFTGTGFSFVVPANGVLEMVGGASSTITTAGLTMPGLSSGKTGAFVTTLADTYLSSGGFSHTSGSVNFNGQTCVFTSFVSSGSSRTLLLGASNITVNGDFTFTGNGLVFTPDTSTITVNATTVDTIVNLKGAAFNILLLKTASGSGSITVLADSVLQCSTLTLSSSTTGTKNKIILPKELTVTGTLTVTGNGQTLHVYGPNFGGRTVLTAAVTVLDNVEFMNVIKSGAAAWTGTNVTTLQDTAWMNHSVTS